MSKFKVGDRIAVYKTINNTFVYKTINNTLKRIVGTVTGIYFGSEEYKGKMIEFQWDKSSLVDVAWDKQCRKLKKKQPLVCWAVLKEEGNIFTIYGQSNWSKESAEDYKKKYTSIPCKVVFLKGIKK